MMIVNCPLAIGWFIMSQANSVWNIFVAAILLGLGLGLMVSPVVRYVGEIWWDLTLKYFLILIQFKKVVLCFYCSEPAYRGIMIAYVNVSVTIGMLLVFVLNTLLPWRTVALVSLFLPILTTIALVFVSFSYHFLF